MSDQKARIAKCQYLGIGALVVGTVVTIFSFFIPGMINQNIILNVQNDSTLTQSNVDKWQSIPGPYGIAVLWNLYLFNCSNIWNVSQSQLYRCIRWSTKVQLPSSPSKGRTCTRKATRLPTLSGRPALIIRQASISQWSLRTSISTPTLLRIRRRASPTKLRCGLSTRQPSRCGIA